MATVYLTEAIDPLGTLMRIAVSLDQRFHRLLTTHSCNMTTPLKGKLPTARNHPTCESAVGGSARVLDDGFLEI
jgi:hypothetical protein